jgi:hypothetical protein
MKPEVVGVKSCYKLCSFWHDESGITSHFLSEHILVTMTVKTYLTMVGKSSAEKIYIELNDVVMHIFPNMPNTTRPAM